MFSQRLQPKGQTTVPQFRKLLTLAFSATAFLVMASVVTAGFTFSPLTFTPASPVPAKTISIQVYAIASRGVGDPAPLNCNFTLFMGGVPTPGTATYSVYSTNSGQISGNVRVPTHAPSSAASLELELTDAVGVPLSTLGAPSATNTTGITLL